MLNFLNMFFQNRPVNSPPIPTLTLLFQEDSKAVGNLTFCFGTVMGEKIWNKRANKNKKHMCPFNTQFWPAQLGSTGE